jgi:transcription antitermination factor NusG
MDNILTWHALYTRSRYELKSSEILKQKGVEVYVPVQRVMRQWSDRRKLITEPVIRSYVFVRISRQQYDSVLDTIGIVRYVFFCGKPAHIPDAQIQILKAVLGAEVEVDCMPDLLKPGMPVRVNAGPLCGLEGELVRMAGRNKVVVRLETLRQALLISLSPLLIEPVRQPNYAALA